jgi:hypothetical protein
MIIQALLSYRQPYTDNTPHITINAPIIKQKLVQIENFQASNNESSIVEYDGRIFAFSWYKKLADGKCVAVKSIENVDSLKELMMKYSPAQFAERYPKGIPKGIPEVKEVVIDDAIWLFTEVKPTELRYSKILESQKIKII